MAHGNRALTALCFGVAKSVLVFAAANPVTATVVVAGATVVAIKNRKSIKDYAKKKGFLQ